MQPENKNENINAVPNISVTQNLSNKNTNNTLSDLSSRYINSPEQNSNKAVYVAIAAVLLILFALMYYFFAPSSDTVVSNNSNPVLTFPDLSKGENANYYNASNTNATNSDYLTEQDYSELVHIWNKPVLAYAFKKDKKIEILQSDIVDTNASGTPVVEATLTQKTIEKEVQNVYFMDRASGNVYRSDLETYRPERISKTTIASASSATFDHTTTYLAIVKDGNLMVDRVSNIENGTYNTENLVDKNVVSVYNNNFDSSILYTKNENGGLALYKIVTTSGKVQRVGFIPLTNVNIVWDNASYLYVSTAPSSRYKQDVMTYNFTTAKLITRNINEGDSLINGGNTLYSKAGNLRYKNILGVDNDLGLKTFASKCLFVETTKAMCSVPNILYGGTLDDWFMGRVSFVDSLYYIDLKSSEKKNFFDQSLVSGENIDSYNMSMYGMHLTFQNKNDDSLWVLDTEYLLK